VEEIGRIFFNLGLAGQQVQLTVQIFLSGYLSRLYLKKKLSYFVMKKMKETKAELNKNEEVGVG
jgi:hypothetical protein